MLAFKIAFFVLVASPFISSAPSNSSTKIDCYISYLNSKNRFTDVYRPLPLVSALSGCDTIVHEYNSVCEKTYNDLFSRNEELKGEYDCIMAEFLRTNACDEVMLNVVYENKRSEGAIDKETYCKLSTESKKKTQEAIKKSVETCAPNSDFVKTFAFHTDCSDPKVVEVKRVVAV